MCRLRWVCCAWLVDASASWVPICVYLLHIDYVRGKPRHIGCEIRICCVVLVGGGGGGAVYLSIGSSNGLPTSNTSVALTDCTMTDNTAPGLCKE